MRTLSIGGTLILGLLVVACGAAQALGASSIVKRDFEISNKSKEAICSVDVVNVQNVVAGGDTHNEKLDIPPGQTKTESINVADGQDRTLRFKSCKGAVIKEQNFPYAKDKAHVDVQ